ncbi:SNF2 family N-terminal domain-containing protein [Aspergillus germanicus]
MVRLFGQKLGAPNFYTQVSSQNWFEHSQLLCFKHYSARDSKVLDMVLEFTQRISFHADSGHDGCRLVAFANGMLSKLEQWRVLMETKYKDKLITVGSEDGDAASRITSFFVELMSAFDLLEEFCISDNQPANDLEDLKERVLSCSEVFMRETNDILAAQPERTLESESGDARYTTEEVSEDEDINQGSDVQFEPDDVYDSTIDDILRSSRRLETLSWLEGSEGLATTLAQEALDFMIQQETGRTPMPFRLWLPVMLDGENFFCHAITNYKQREPPRECGGGILADEYGMGKTLTTLVLIEKTMADAIVWAQDPRKSLAPCAPKKRPCRATLVIVPTRGLIDNWIKQIKGFFAQRLKTLVYLSGTRRDSIGEVQSHDIVLTTYAQLAIDYSFSGESEVNLYDFEWYRVVLDEAHMIRNQATQFYTATASIEARYSIVILGNTLDLLAKELQLASIKYQLVDGKTFPPMRATNIEEFIHNNEITALWITTGAMQNYTPSSISEPESRPSDLNQKALTRIINVEPQWNLAVERDAIEKSIGATTVLGREQWVYVTRYVVEDSIEQDMHSKTINDPTNFMTETPA